MLPDALPLALPPVPALCSVLPGALPGVLVSAEAGAGWFGAWACCIGALADDSVLCADAMPIEPIAATMAGTRNLVAFIFHFSWRWIRGRFSPRAWNAARAVGSESRNSTESCRSHDFQRTRVVLRRYRCRCRSR